MTERGGKTRARERTFHDSGNHVNFCRHIALDREHLERNEAKLKEEVENRAAQPISAKLKLEEKLSDVEVILSVDDLCYIHVLKFKKLYMSVV